MGNSSIQEDKKPTVLSRSSRALEFPIIIAYLTIIFISCNEVLSYKIGMHVNLLLIYFITRQLSFFCKRIRGVKQWQASNLSRDATQWHWWVAFYLDHVILFYKSKSYLSSSKSAAAITSSKSKQAILNDSTATRLTSLLKQCHQTVTWTLLAFSLDHCLTILHDGRIPLCSARNKKHHISAITFLLLVPQFVGFFITAVTNGQYPTLWVRMEVLI